MRLKSSKLMDPEPKSTGSVLPGIISDLYKNGTITKADLSSKRLVFAKLRKFIDSDVVDSRLENAGDDVLRLADEQFASGNRDMAISLYVAAIENSLNTIIRHGCRLRRIDVNTEMELIKSVTISAKCTWLLKLLDLPTLNGRQLEMLLTFVDQDTFKNTSPRERQTRKTQSGTGKVEMKHKPDHAKAIRSLLKYLKAYQLKVFTKGS